MIVLRPFVDDDRDQVRLWRNSPDVASQMFTHAVITPDQHAAWFARVRSSRTSRYWIIEEAGQRIGVANLADIDLDNGTCEWAYYLGARSARGHATPGAVEYGVLDYAFRVLGLRKVSCQVLRTNGRVAQFHRRFGFRDEGLLRGHVVKNGTPVDVHVLAIFRGEWLSRADRFARLFASLIVVLDPTAQS